MPRNADPPLRVLHGIHQTGDDGVVDRQPVAFAMIVVFVDVVPRRVQILHARVELLDHIRGRIG